VSAAGGVVAPDTVAVGAQAAAVVAGVVAGAEATAGAGAAAAAVTGGLPFGKAPADGASVEDGGCVEVSAGGGTIGRWGAPFQVGT